MHTHMQCDVMDGATYKGFWLREQVRGMGTRRLGEWNVSGNTFYDAGGVTASSVGP